MKHVLSAVLLVAAGGPAFADHCDELLKLKAPDPGDDDRFGSAVAIEGDITVVGSPNDDDQGSNAGAVYIFDSVSGDLLTKLVAADGTPSDQFGAAVALDGGHAIIGAPQGHKAYVYDLADPSNPVLVTTVTAPETSRFGYSVDIKGNVVAVGDIEASPNGHDSGEAYLFDATTGEMLADLVPDDGISNDYFGISVALGDDRVVVGALYDDDNGEDTGSAYIFDIDGTQMHKLVPSRAPYFGFGAHAAAEGSLAIISTSNSAYIYDLSTGEQMVNLDTGGCNGGAYGSAVDMHGGVAIVGGQFCEEAHLFDVATGEPIRTLTASDVTAYFGAAVALSDSLAVVGAYDDPDGAPHSGAAYTFALDVYCASDLNEDCEHDILDFVMFQQLWLAQAPAADCDGNGDFNIMDFICFQAAFVGGCD